MRSLDGSARSLVNLETGEIDREIYVNAAIYQEEQPRIFARAWLYVGHESQIARPGDFIVSKMGEESVILTRDKANRFHVFLNSCRHRGMKVCRYDEGNTAVFTCPYHAWTYDLSGKLTGVQDYENAYRPPFDRSQWGLVEVAQLATLNGMIWATWDANAPSFDDFLGGARFALDLGFRAWDGSENNIEILCGTQKWIAPSNWKIIAENFSGDALHNVSHKSVDTVGIGPSEGAGRRDRDVQYRGAAYPEGHGIVYGIFPAIKGRMNYATSKITADYFQDCWERRLARMGELAGVTPHLGTIFPNMSFHAIQPRSILVSHPRGPCETEMWRVYFVDKDAPVEVRQFLKRYYLRYSGPGGMTEQDDMENWNCATAASRGVVSRKFPFNYKAGLGAEGSDAVIPGIVAQRKNSEQNPRALYKRWAEFMDAAEWSDLVDATVAKSRREGR